MSLVAVRVPRTDAPLRLGAGPACTSAAARGDEGVVVDSCGKLGDVEHHARCRGKLHTVRTLVDVRDVVALQETHGHNEDLAELLKMFLGCGVAAGRNSGGAVVLVRLSFLATATSTVSMPNEPGQALRVMMDFVAGSLNVAAFHSDLAQSSGVRKQW